METMRNIDKILFDFLWDKKPHKINKEIVIKPKAEGGLVVKGGKMHIWHLYQRNEIIPWKDLSKIEYRYI